MITIEELSNKYAFYIRGNLDDVRQTIEIATKAAQLEGDMCECGSYIGGCCAIMGDICSDYNKNKYIYLYDSFEGIPYPTEEDGEIPGAPEGITRTGELKSTGVSIATLEWVQKVLSLSNYNIDNFKLIKGWLQNTLPENIETMPQLSFLRVDVDLYVPTKLSLEYLYDKVVDGGYVLVHDYYALSGCKKAVDEFVVQHPEIELISSDGALGVYWIKNRRGV